MSSEIFAMPEELAALRLLWLFVFLITVLMLSLCYVFLAMRRARERETESREFSNLAIEGLETERRRVSRELHDTVLPLVQDQAVSALIRSICTELVPPDFSRLSLTDSLADLCMQFTKRTGIDCPLSIEENLDFSLFSPENQLHLYRMVQESLTNIGKHSGARKASLVARRFTKGSSENILICVSDDGKGLKTKVGEGLGMRSMRQRAAILGARLDFKSENGNGLMVRIELKMRNEE